jgi:hypothetical protein
MVAPLHYHLESLPRKDTFSVTVAGKPVGTIRHFFIRHLERHGWEANGPDGHLAVHEHQWQALWALTWDRKGYPFPVAASHQRNVIVG